MTTRLTDDQLDAFVRSVSAAQAAVISQLRHLIQEGDPGVSERIETGKWLTGYLKYDSPGGDFLYAIGVKHSGAVSFHAMTYYGSPELQRAFGDALAAHAAGRSCFDFNPTEALPLEAIRGLVTNGSAHLARAKSASG